MTDFNAMFGIQSAEETQAALADADFAKGFEIASVMALTIDKQIREGYPDQSEAFYRGIMDGIRSEI